MRARLRVSWCAAVKPDRLVHMNNSRKVAGIAGIASVLWVGFTAAIAASQRRLVFNPVIKREVASPRSSGHRTRLVTLRTSDGTKLSGLQVVVETDLEEVELEPSDSAGTTDLPGSDSAE